MTPLQWKCSHGECSKDRENFNLETAVGRGEKKKAKLCVFFSFLVFLSLTLALHDFFCWAPDHMFRWPAYNLEWSGGNSNYVLMCVLGSSPRNGFFDSKEGGFKSCVCVFWKKSPQRTAVPIQSRCRHAYGMFTVRKMPLFFWSRFFKADFFLAKNFKKNCFFSVNFLIIIIMLHFFPKKFWITNRC